MITEFIIVYALLFLATVLFYRQRRSDLTILQLEESQVEAQLSELLSEKQPLILRGSAQPKGLTQESLQKIQRLAGFPVGGQPLSSVLANPGMLASAGGLPTLSQEAREQLAEELSIPVWANHTWLPRLNQTSWFGWATGSLRSEVVLGGLGLSRTTAITTCIMPTEGKYHVSILFKDSEEFLPAKWEYRYPSTFTVNDTPLVSDLKYLDIVLRPGTVLMLPAHTIFSLAPAPDSSPFQAAVVVEYHEPVSILSRTLKG